MQVELLKIPPNDVGRFDSNQVVVLHRELDFHVITGTHVRCMSNGKLAKARITRVEQAGSRIDISVVKDN